MVYVGKYSSPMDPTGKELKNPTYTRVKIFNYKDNPTYELPGKQVAVNFHQLSPLRIGLFPFQMAIHGGDPNH